MKKIYTLLFFLSVISLSAQDRYLDADFGVEVTSNVIYGSNISIITGAPAAQDLVMDVYSPSGDTETTRPVMLVAHTGSFLPALFNGSVTGSKSDSTVVNICKGLAARGYVAVAFSYRAGWLPTSLDEDVRRGTLLTAAYRGIQDARSCVRFMRKTAAVDGNPYGIDPDNIGMVGVGTGSYIAYGCGSFYDYSEIQIEKFISTTTATNYIDTTLVGNIYGDTNAAICLANTPGYSSTIKFAFSLGGALGDKDWIDGDDFEAAFAGVHCVQDIFAPYGDGPVIVPTTNEFVVNVSGNRTAIEKANESGNNDILNDSGFSLGLEANMAAQAATNVDPFLSAPIDMGTDHFYGFNLPFPQGSPWSWWDKPTLDAVVAGTNAATGAMLNSDTLHLSGLQTNPGMSQAQGLAYLDTVMMVLTPRACLAFDLGCNLPVDLKEIEAPEVGLSIYPNPSANFANITVDEDVTIENVYIYSVDGRLVQANVSINNSSYVLERNNIANGVYIARITTNKGIVSKELIFN